MKLKYLLSFCGTDTSEVGFSTIYGRSFRSSNGEGLRYGWDWVCFGQAFSVTSGVTSLSLVTANALWLKHRYEHKHMDSPKVHPLVLVQLGAWLVVTSICDYLASHRLDPYEALNLRSVCSRQLHCNLGPCINNLKDLHAEHNSGEMSWAKVRPTLPWLSIITHAYYLFFPPH